MKRRARRPGRASILSRLQRGLEVLYRVETNLQVDAFVIDDEQRRRAGVVRAPREQLLVREDAGELGLGLFVDGAALANLERNDPNRRLDDANFADFCVALEGVSHFVYVALCAAGHRRVSALELELQAEVDKFVCCVLRRLQFFASGSRKCERQVDCSRRRHVPRRFSVHTTANDRIGHFVVLRAADSVNE